MNTQIKIYKDPFELAKFFSEEIVNKSKKKLNIALSGGSTPKILFETLSVFYKNKINWDNINFFWGDERCVPPDNSESNYGMTKEYLFNNIIIDNKNIHRIKGEIEPITAAEEYEKIILNNIKKNENGIPVFDWIILGIGTDGHTASIFPNSELVYAENNICAVATHPVTNQKRITFSLKVINNSKRISFLVTGMSKAKTVYEIISKKNSAEKFPASHVNNEKGLLEWWLDDEAASLI